MSATRIKDLLGLMKGIQMISCASVRTQEAYLKQIWSNSSIRDVLEQNLAQTQNCTKKIISNPAEELKQISKIIQETLDRSSVVVEGITRYNTAGTVSNASSSSEPVAETSNIKADLKNLDIASITLKELENLLSEHSKNREVSLRIEDKNKKIADEKKVNDVVKPEPAQPIATTSAQPVVEKSQSPPIETKEEKVVEVKKRASEKDFEKDEKSVKNMMNLISNYQKPESSSSSDSDPVKIVVPEVSVSV